MSLRANVPMSLRANVIENSPAVRERVLTVVRIAAETGHTAKR